VSIAGATSAVTVTDWVNFANLQSDVDCLGLFSGDDNIFE